MSLERLWAGWRTEYVGGTEPSGCVFCRILASGHDHETTRILSRGAGVVAILNAYPYTSGHLMVMPERHIGDLGDMTGEESTALWAGVHEAVAAVTAAYRPGGINLGANLGRAAGAGVPAHLHIHVVPRWAGDTNFMTTVAEARVLPEGLGATWERLRAAWPREPSAGPASGDGARDPDEGVLP